MFAVPANSSLPRTEITGLTELSELRSNKDVFSPPRKQRLPWFDLAAKAAMKRASTNLTNLHQNSGFRGSTSGRNGGG